jgi:hypothetical protein
MASSPFYADAPSKPHIVRLSAASFNVSVGLSIHLEKFYLRQARRSSGWSLRPSLFGAAGLHIVADRRFPKATLATVGGRVRGPP